MHGTHWMTQTLFALMVVTDNNVGEKNLFRARTFIFYIGCVKLRELCSFVLCSGHAILLTAATCCSWKQEWEWSYVQDNKYNKLKIIEINTTN